MTFRGDIFWLGDAENHDPASLVLTPDELKRMNNQQISPNSLYTIKPGQVVFIPKREYRETYLRPIITGGQPIAPVVAVTLMEKIDDVYVSTSRKIEIGISSLFTLDYEGKPHENDDTCAYVAHLPNFCEQLDAIGGKVIQAGKECMIKVPVTRNRILMYENGKLVTREKRIIPSRILNDDEWEYHTWYLDLK